MVEKIDNNEKKSSLINTGIRKAKDKKPRYCSQKMSMNKNTLWVRFLTLEL